MRRFVVLNYSVANATDMTKQARRASEKRKKEKKEKRKKGKKKKGVIVGTIGWVRKRNVKRVTFRITKKTPGKEVVIDIRISVIACDWRKYREMWEPSRGPGGASVLCGS